jgi:hypothetical protein
VSAPPCSDLESILELRTARNAAWNELLWWLGFDAQRPRTARQPGWYSANRALELAELRLQSAQWHQAVESHRWMRASATEGYPDANWWWIWRGVMALRWSLSGRANPPMGFNRSTEIALRDPAPVVCSSLFRPEC